MRVFRCCVLLMLVYVRGGATEYPPVTAAVGEAFGHGVQRTMTLLAGSTPENRATVRVLFYGQSITGQAWWRAVRDHLRNTYPEADLVIENRAIGGYGAEIMVRAAESDLFPFYPDLVVFQVYGSLADYERLIRNIRERTTSEILIQTDHLTLDEEITEVTDPARAEEMSANAKKNYVFLPRLCETYGAELVDVRSGWKDYLVANGLSAHALLKDHIHLNAHGEYVMGELVKPHLRQDPTFFRGGWREATKTYYPGRDFDWTDGIAELEFAGNRVDLIFEPGAVGEVTAYVDGLRPSEHLGSYGMTRSSPAEGDSRPSLVGIEFETLPVIEDWTLTITNWNATTRQVEFYVQGSVTGYDGAGSSGQRFRSDSGRVVLEPAAWSGARLAWWAIPPRPGFQIRWGAMHMGRDSASPKEGLRTGVEDAVTIVQGIPNGHHRLRMEGGSETLVRAIRVYNPEGMRLGAPRILKGSSEAGGLVLQVQGQGALQLEQKLLFSPDDEAWQDVGEPVVGSAVQVEPPPGSAFFRLRLVE